MTTEEKARAYDEALEAMRQWIAPCHTKEQLDTLKKSVFPELADSDDERIRKQLIDAIKIGRSNSGISFTEEAASRFIAWLEKQKENPKSADSIPSDCMSVAKCEDRDSNYGVFPEDVIVVARACEKLEAHGYPELAHALKNVNLYTKEQKPVDYDHEMWKNCSANFEGGKKEVIEHPEKYGLQKPAEWNEEDEDMLNSCISSIEEAKENRYAYKETDGDTSYDHEIAWLKSLRPSWKPSKEQMKALLNAEGFLRAGLQHDSAKTIADLYEQLKKL